MRSRNVLNVSISRESFKCIFKFNPFFMQVAVIADSHAFEEAINHAANVKGI